MAKAGVLVVIRAVESLTLTTFLGIPISISNSSVVHPLLFPASYNFFHKGKEHRNANTKRERLYNHPFRLGSRLQMMGKSPRTQMDIVRSNDAKGLADAGDAVGIHDESPAKLHTVGVQTALTGVDEAMGLSGKDELLNCHDKTTSTRVKNIEMQTLIENVLYNYPFCLGSRLRMIGKRNGDRRRPPPPVGPTLLLCKKTRSPRTHMNMLHSNDAKGLADARDAVGIHGEQKVVPRQGHVGIGRNLHRKRSAALSGYGQRQPALVVIDGMRHGRCLDHRKCVGDGRVHGHGEAPTGARARDGHRLDNRSRRQGGAVGIVEVGRCENFIVQVIGGALTETAA
jgi:hypothetical protein